MSYNNLNNTLKWTNIIVQNKYLEYSRDLEQLSVIEGQSAILKIATEIPEILNWNSYQIQKNQTSSP